MTNHSRNERQAANEDVLTSVDLQHLSAITSTISSGRLLLLIIAVISVWIISAEIMDMVRWENLRDPYSHYVVRTAWKQLCTKADLPKIGVPYEDLRAPEKKRYLEKIANGSKAYRYTPVEWQIQIEKDNATLQFTAGTPIDSRHYSLAKDSLYRGTFNLTEPEALPKMVYLGVGGSWKDSLGVILCPESDASYEEIVEWCRHYHSYAYDQWSNVRIPAPRDANDTVAATKVLGIILGRAKITEGQLPKTVVTAPQMTVPIVGGFSINKDDLEIVAASVLVLGMLWMSLYVKRIAETIDVAIDHFRGTRLVGFLSNWLPGQFLFISVPKESGTRQSKAEIEPFVYLMFMVPYAALVFTISEDLFSRLYQMRAYSILTGYTSQFNAYCGALEGDLVNDVVGLTLARMAILVGAAWWLWHRAIGAGEHMMAVNRHLRFVGLLIKPGPKEPDRPKEADAKRCDRRALRAIQAWLTVVVIGPIFSFYLARWVSVDTSVGAYGWAFAPDTIAVLIPITITTALVWLFRRQHKDILRRHDRECEKLI